MKLANPQCRFVRWSVQHEFRLESELAKLRKEAASLERCLLNLANPGPPLRELVSADTIRALQVITGIDAI